MLKINHLDGKFCKTSWQSVYSRLSRSDYTRFWQLQWERHCGKARHWSLPIQHDDIPSVPLGMAKASYLSETMKKRKNKNLPQDQIAMRIADRYGMTREYKTARRNGLSPIEAMEDRDMVLSEERKLFCDL